MYKNFDKYVKHICGYDKDFVLAVACIDKTSEGKYLYRTSDVLQSIPVTIDELYKQFDIYSKSKLKIHNTSYEVQAMSKFGDILDKLESQEFDDFEK